MTAPLSSPPQFFSGAAPVGRRCASTQGDFFRGRLMASSSRIQLTRRDMLKLSLGGAGAFALTASGFSVPRGFSSGGGSLYLEAFPTSPLILNAFRDIPDN